MHTTDHGKGHVVVLIHGFCENLSLWKSFIKELAKSNRIISIDLPGFGNSPALNGVFSIDNVAQNIHNCLLEKNIKSYTCLGHSLGGYVALSLRSQFPESVKALGLIHSTAFPDSEEKKLSRDKAVLFIQDNGLSSFLTSFISNLFDDNQQLQLEPEMEEVKKMSAGISNETIINYVIAMRNRKDTHTLLTDSSLKILFVCGLHDKLISIHDNKKQIELIKDHTYTHIISNSAHMSMYESPLPLLTAITSFLKDVNKF